MVEDHNVKTYCALCFRAFDSDTDVVSYYFAPRGIGLNWIPCFMCGKGGPEDHSQPDMAAYVKGKDYGELVISMFDKLGLLANLDYRPSEPNYVQVKVGACVGHQPNLRLLQIFTASRKLINEDILKEVSGKL